MVQKLTDIVLIITGFQLILLAAVIFFQQCKNKMNRNLLVAFLLTKAFLIIRWFSFRYEILDINNHQLAYHVSSAVFFLLAPVLYLYIASLIYKSFELKRIHLIHIIPFFSFVVFAAVVCHFQNQSDINYSSLMTSLFMVNYWKIFWTMNFLQIFLYIFLMARHIYFYKTTLRNFYSTVEKISLNWLIMLLSVISLHWIFVVTRGIFSVFNLKNNEFIQLMDLFSIIIFLSFTTILVFKGLIQLRIATGLDIKEKYANSKLPDVEKQQYMEKLTAYMNTQRPYLKPTLTIDDLSKKLSIPSWHLSQVINDSFDQNFFNFINHYRIEEAKRLFLESKSTKKTVLEVIYESGFNSKSTFNNIFKKYTGMTPSEFKKRHSN